MLSELLRLLRQNRNQFDIKELGRQLDVQPSAVAGMLETLISIGRIEEIGSDCGVCEACSIHSQCSLPVKGAKQYKINRQA
jgi:hypothetical protein